METVEIRYMLWQHASGSVYDCLVRGQCTRKEDTKGYNRKTSPKMGFGNNCMFMLAGAATMYVYTRYRPPMCPACRARKPAKTGKRSSRIQATKKQVNENPSGTANSRNVFTAAAEKLSSYFGYGTSDDSSSEEENESPSIETPPMGLAEYIDILYKKQITQEQNPCRPQMFDPNDVVCILDNKGEKISLGSGQTGEVFLGIICKTGLKVAVKMFNTVEYGIDKVIHEAAILTHLNETNTTPHCYGLLPQPQGSDSEPLKAAIVMDFVGDISKNAPALDILSFVIKNKLNKTQMRSLSIQIAQKLQKIHKKGVVLNDLRKQNVLVVFKEDNSIVEPILIDVGSARFGDMEFPVPDSFRENRHNYTHMAPELLHRHDPNPQVSPETDVFSYGKLLDEIGKELNVMVFMECGIFCMRGTPHKRLTLERVLEILEQTKYSCVMENFMPDI